MRGNDLKAAGYRTGTIGTLGHQFAGEVINADRDWWCQAEAVVGFRHAFELSGERLYAAASERVWRSIVERVVDREHGEWFWTIRDDGTVDLEQPKVSEWKGPYHNVRMCLEMMRRLPVRGGE